MRIAIDAGHGPETAGKRTPDDSLREYEFNSAVALELDRILQEYDKVETFHVHSPMLDVPLQNRVAIANERKADLYVSIHANAAGNDWHPAGGIETYVYTSRPAAAVALANAVQRQLVKATGLADRGVKSNDFYVLRETNMTAILAECGFMTNRVEAELLKTDEYRKKCAQAIATGIVDTYGLTKKAGGLVIKERIRAVNGKLEYLPFDYSQPGTDVRFIKFERGKAKYKFIARPGAKVSQLVKEFGADYGVNFPYFDPSAKLPIGTVWDGEKYINGAWGKAQKWHFLACKDGQMTFRRPGENVEDTDFAFQGSPVLISDGDLCWDYFRQVEEVADDIGLGRSQRIFAGIDAEGNFLLAVSDGRTKYDQGLTLEEMALYMKDKGAIFAINGDGGGSSILADRTGGLNQAENTGANERTVHHALLIFLQDEPAPKGDWKQESVEWLHAQGLTDTVRDPDTTPTWAELGAVLRKYDDNGGAE